MNVLEHGILYGLPKIHKVNVPLCLIRSSIITHSFKIAKFPVPLLRSISSGIGVWLQILFLCSRITRLTSQNYNNMHTIKNVVRRLKWLINISGHAPEAYLHLVNLKIRHNTGVAKHWVVNSYFLIIIKDYILCWWGIAIQIIFSDFAFNCYNELSTPCVVFMNCLLVTLWGQDKEPTNIDKH